MSKLPKAPLVEVVLEIRWNIIEKSDLTRIQYLYGDIYSELKHQYPFRESIVSPEIPLDVLINQPTHRFRKAVNEYPLFQVGPGILTLNTIDNNYYWENFLKWTEELVDSFLKVFPINKSENLTPSVLFLDFFPFDFSKGDAYQFLNDKFNIVFNQSFISNVNYPKDLNLGFFYDIPEGNLSISFQKGKNKEQKEGIVLQTRINGYPIVPAKREMLDWIILSHEASSELFKKLTEGELYESFKY